MIGVIDREEERTMLDARAWSLGDAVGEPESGVFGMEWDFGSSSGEDVMIIVCGLVV